MAVVWETSGSQEDWKLGICGPAGVGGLGFEDGWGFAMAGKSAIVGETLGNREDWKRGRRRPSAGCTETWACDVQRQGHVSSDDDGAGEQTYESMGTRRSFSKRGTPR
ncbi:MAG: hypothetical protein LC620_06015, partial [Halobacteriales archaeon]|nr:hypothetical protein [Halobacteriales archaeon]